MRKVYDDAAMMHGSSPSGSVTGRTKQHVNVANSAAIVKSIADERPNRRHRPSAYRRPPWSIGQS